MNVKVQILDASIVYETETVLAKIGNEVVKIQIHKANKQRNLTRLYFLIRQNYAYRPTFHTCYACNLNVIPIGIWT